MSGSGLLAGVVMVSASNHDQGGHAHHGGEQEKANNNKCLKDPGHRCAPVYTLARVPQEDPQREYAKSVDVQSERLVLH
jgi:hypothetical protein